MDVGMSQLIPNGRELHQIVAHLPLILLLVAPILVMFSIGQPAGRRDLFLGVALTLMVAGTLTTFVALITGEAALKTVGSNPGFQTALAEHRALAQSTVELFSVLTVGFAALFFAPRLLRRKLDSYLNTALLAIYLVFYATGSLLLIHTALQGGHVVRALEAKATASYHLAGKEIAR